MKVLISSGVDLLALETVPCKLEAESLVNLLEEEFQDTFAWLGFSCRDFKKVCHGETFAECYALVAQCKQVISMCIFF